MPTPKERSDESDGALSPQQPWSREPSRHAAAQQQGDGQPENVRELEDRSSGSAQADRPESPAQLSSARDNETD